MQCTTTFFLQKHNLKSKTLPFDWMFSTPKFVFEMLHLLLEQDANIPELVGYHFFNCNKTVSNVDNNFIISDNDGYVLYNETYNVIFPHEIESYNHNDYNADSKLLENLNKYLRRFERLKNLILNPNEELCFIYTSQSSLKSGNFTINCNNAINDAYFYLNKIYELISKYKNNFKFIIFDALKEDNKSLLNEKIILVELNSCDNYHELLPQMDNFIHFCL